jgi:hypothetical protein
VSFEKPAAYEPPAGFENASVDGAPKSSQLLKESNLQGKQIWYITAPASVPLSSVKEFSLLDIKERRKILSHDGDNYSFVQDASEAKTSTKILVPNASDDGYRSSMQAYPHTDFTPLRSIAKTPLAQVLHLQQIIQLANPTSQATVPAKKPVRQQPPGLKMRFHPVGFDSVEAETRGSSSSSEAESGSGSDSDQEMKDSTPAKFRKPESLSSTDSSDDSGDDDSGSDAEMTEAPPVPSKPAAKSKTTAKGSTKTADSSLKRKHGEGGDKKSKHSSSTSASTINDRKLKRLKTKQIDDKNPLGSP